MLDTEANIALIEEFQTKFSALNWNDPAVKNDPTVLWETDKPKDILNRCTMRDGFYSVNIMSYQGETLVVASYDNSTQDTMPDSEIVDNPYGAAYTLFKDTGELIAQCYSVDGDIVEKLPRLPKPTANPKTKKHSLKNSANESPLPAPPVVASGRLRLPMMEIVRLRC